MKWGNEDRLSQLLSLMLNNSYSSFYKEKYEKAGISLASITPETFIDLPLLSRRELVETPISRRTYVPKKDVCFVAFTSGTSSAQPLITPFSAVENYFFEPSLGLPITRPLIIYPPLNKNFGHTFLQQCQQAEIPVTPIFADFQNLANSSLIAREMECDSLYATPTIAALFIEHARRQGILQNIKLLALSSETLTVARREELANAYPNALIANLYASSEIGQFVMFPCVHIMKQGKNHFHILTSALAAVELIEGELVVSYGLNRASPLLRYRTGDMFEAVQETCPCGLPGPIVKWSHRSAVDRLRINGVEFDVESADKAFSTLSRLPRAEYQVHFRSSVGVGVGMEVEIVDSSPTRSEQDTLLTARFLEEELKDSWRVSGTSTLRVALERGLFSNLRVVLVRSVSVSGNKTTRFVNHLR